jgi:hypothetical protein
MAKSKEKSKKKLKNDCFPHRTSQIKPHEDENLNFKRLKNTSAMHFREEKNQENVQFFGLTGLLNQSINQSMKHSIITTRLHPLLGNLLPVRTVTVMVLRISRSVM